MSSNVSSKQEQSSSQTNKTDKLGKSRINSFMIWFFFEASLTLTPLVLAMYYIVVKNDSGDLALLFILLVCGLGKWYSEGE